MWEKIGKEKAIRWLSRYRVIQTSIKKMNRETSRGCLRRTHDRLLGTVTLWLRVIDIAIVVFIWFLSYFFFLAPLICDDIGYISTWPDIVSCKIDHFTRERGSVPIFTVGQISFWRYGGPENRKKGFSSKRRKYFEEGYWQAKKSLFPPSWWERATMTLARYKMRPAWIKKENTQPPSNHS